MIGRALPGEKGDRKVTRNGRGWRVRVKLKDELPTDAPVNGNPDLVPSAVSIVVSVALLDEGDAVAKDSQGRLLIFDPEPVTFMGAEISKPGFDPEDLIKSRMEALIARAEAQLPSREKINSLLSHWGS